MNEIPRDYCLTSVLALLSIRHATKTHTAGYDSMSAALFILIGEAFIIGVLATPHCLSMCGPFAISAVHTGSETKKGSNVASYSLGRITTYAILCSLAGTISLGLENFRFVAWIVSVAAVAFAAAHILGWIQPARWAHAPSRFIGKFRAAGTFAEPYFIGLSTALLPCGMVFAAAGLAVSAGSPLGGALVGVAFGIGTSPGLGVLAWLGGKATLQRTSHRVLLAAIVLVTGIGIATLRLGASMYDADRRPVSSETGNPDWLCVP